MYNLSPDHTSHTPLQVCLSPTHPTHFTFENFEILNDERYRLHSEALSIL